MILTDASNQRTVINTAVLLLAMCCTASATAQDPQFELERSGLVYSVGRVERTISGAALIDLGYIHNLSAVAPRNKVAVFRVEQSWYVPLGTLTVAETFETTSLTRPNPRVNPQPGDIVMYVRELSQLKAPREHSTDFLRERIVRTRNTSSYSTTRLDAVARALDAYQTSYRRWERSEADVVGFMNGQSYADGGERRLQRLLNFLQVMRESYRRGYRSVEAAGPKWVRVIEPILGPTVIAQHAASQDVGQADPLLANMPQISPRDIRREVDEHLFDQSEAQRNTLAFIVADLLERSPRNDDIWFQQALLQSQFPELIEEDYILEQVREILKARREG